MSKRKLPDLSKKVFPYDLVLAYWEDITSDSSWVDINDIKKSTTAICCTVGWLMKQDSNVTILMSDFNIENVHFFPLCGVKNVSEFVQEVSKI